MSEHLLKVSMLLRKDPNGKVPVLVGLKRGGDDEVLPRRQTEAVADLSEIDEGLWAGLGRIAQEESPIQMNLSLPCILKQMQGKKDALKHVVTRGHHHSSFRTCYNAITAEGANMQMSFQNINKNWHSVFASTVYLQTSMSLLCKAIPSHNVQTYWPFLNHNQFLSTTYLIRHLQGTEKKHLKY